MGEIRERLRKNLAYYLTTKNISQKALAESLNVSQAAVTNWIKGKNSPDIEVIAELCEVLNISINDLLELPSDKIETELLQKYRSLDDYGQKNVDTLLENEYQRCKHAKEELSAKELLREIQEKQSSHSYVAAFGGQTDFKELTPEKAAEAIKELERIVKEQK